MLESTYLIRKNRAICQKLITEGNFSENNIIDILISLHLVLEIGINGLFHVISLKSFEKDIDMLDIMENVDKIGFIEKINMFIYFGSFNFDKKLDKATKYHKILNTLKDFTYVRNALLHGHSIMTIYEFQKGSKEKSTRMKDKLNKIFLQEHIKQFKFIMDGIGFYLECYETDKISVDIKSGWYGTYLNTGFLK